MAKRWVNGGVWAILMASAMLAGGRSAMADQPAKPGKFRISDVIIRGNQRMTTEQIKMRLHTHIGQEYNKAIVDDDVRDLYKTNEFSNIATWEEAGGAHRVKVYFVLREMPNLVQKVTFQGAKHIKDEELRTLTGVKPGMPLNPNLNLQGCQRIIDKYDEMGRRFAHCTLVKGGKLADTEVVYQITEGPKITVRDIQFTGNTFLSSARLATQLKLKEKFPLPVGTYNKQMADAVVDELYKYFRSFGYLDVRIALEMQRSTDGGEVTLIFHIEEGQRYKIQDVPEVPATQRISAEQLQAQSRLKPVDYRDGPILMIDRISYHGQEAIILSNPPIITDARPPARVGQIRIIGNQRISTESILAHVPLYPGQVLSYPELQQAEKNLAKLGLFVVDAATGVRPTIAVVDGEGVYKDLLITVREKAKRESVKRVKPQG
jgi:outer membrane protein insertion porin family